MKLSFIAMLMLIILNEIGMAQMCLDVKFIPSGWMGDYSDITYNANWRNGCKTDTTCMSEGTCICITYSALKTNNAGWAGIYWLYENNDLNNEWGSLPGMDLRGVRRLIFWARGERGGEAAEFKIGGITNDSIQPATSTGTLILTNNWKKYIIDLANRDLKNINGGFCWVADSDKNRHGCTFYLSDIQYEYNIR